MKKIAIAKEGNIVSAHFGHCEGFEVITVEGKEVVGRQQLVNPGHKPGFLPQYLKDWDVNVIIAGGMGARAQQLFAAASIDVVVGASGALDEVLRRYISGELVSTGSTCSEHAHAGSCGGHE